MPVFEIGETSQQPGAEPGGLFGVWNVASPVLAPTAREPVGALSFGVLGGKQAETAPDIPVWRARLPADPTRATEQLARSQSRLAASRQALPDAKDRLDTLAKRGREAHDTHASPATLSFSAGPPSPDATLHQLRAASGGAEAMLLDGLLDINQEGEARDQVSPATLGPGVSFGIGETIGEWGEAISQYVQHFASQVTQAFSAYARVETEIGERAIAHTTVRWTGDVETVWRSGTSADYAEYLGLHGETLTLAIASRDALVRTIVLAAAGAIKLSFLITTPTGVVLAIPKLWEYINRILRE